MRDRKGQKTGGGREGWGGRVIKERNKNTFISL